MAFDNIHLEKGMYHEAGRSFTQVLEQLDPSEGYRGTPLENTRCIGHTLFNRRKYVQIFAIGGSLRLDIVHLYAIIQVQRDAQGGKMGNIFLIFLALFLLQLQLI